MTSRSAAAILLVVACPAIGCGGAGGAESTATKTTPAADGAAAEPAVPVEVAILARGAMERVLRSSTHLEAERAVEVRSEAARKVVALLVEEGQNVGKGQALARLEDDEQRTALSRARGKAEQARREHERQANLHDRKMVSEQDFARVRHELEQAELALLDAERELSYTVVRAPIAGTVTARHVRLGQTVAIAQPLFDLVDFGSLVALAFVPEKDLAAVAVGQAARLGAPLAPGRRFDGRVERIAPVVDPKSGTVKVTVTVPFADGLRPGMLLELELVTAVERDALLVPKRAVIVDGTRQAVWRLAEDSTVERVWIEPGLEDREQVSVATGLTAGDRVVVAGQSGLKAGAKVEVVGTPRAAG